MFCEKCGSIIEKGDTVCKHCGNYIMTGNNSQYNNNQNQQMNNQGYNQNQQMNNQVNYASDAKSKIAAGILAIMFGTLGIHNFYLGYTGKAVAQLLISLLSFGFLAWIVYIWAFIEGIMIFTGSIKVDAKGNLLKD